MTRPAISAHRSSGILCHITSLPGKFGCGDLGPAADDFIDFLQRTGQTRWQVLPLGPTGYGDSPYQCYSAFAGNPLLISLERLVDDGLLTAADLKAFPVSADETKVDFDQVRPAHEALLRRAYDNYRSLANAKLKLAFIAFQNSQAAWLADYSLFAALKEFHGGSGWTVWQAEFARRDLDALARVRVALAEAIERHAFVQFLFARQWQAVRKRCHAAGIMIIGDAPIFVSHDSADVWANPDLFYLDAAGQPTVVAGVPPDYFSATGQRWGNPLYRWHRMHANGYDWWCQRMAHSLQMFDFVRLDHFRGFEAYWEIPGTSPTAVGGRWVFGPGKALFEALAAKLGGLPIYAEDLGLITPEVEQLRDELGLPGMRVLQFAFGDDAKSLDYRPHNYPRHCVVYTGTHDNDTTVGWFLSAAGDGTTRNNEQVERERNLVLSYVGGDGSEIHWDMIRQALGSIADTAIVPAQDLLGLGSAARMNLPGTGTGNWSWRMPPGALTPAIEKRLATLTMIFDRDPVSPDAPQIPVTRIVAEKALH
ncbi:4-alpha-glucanotransferase [Anatilimnocola aggregata]|uniref:4-alpha-glucanotransferase n=1 Tax=Anatilimnocola aggregata TaxID=2528021 RepID=A0A517YIT7_9BACT|nr:4-alpha-glucanotransferase [Anatilimnocola aggregata]QDU30125.1 4-alpha-glucanotransferase [Anatilimnocola aggregata]